MCIHTASVYHQWGSRTLYDYQSPRKNILQRKRGRVLWSLLTLISFYSRSLSSWSSSKSLVIMQPPLASGCGFPDCILKHRLQIFGRLPPSVGTRQVIMPWALYTVVQEGGCVISGFRVQSLRNSALSLQLLPAARKGFVIRVTDVSSFTTSTQYQGRPESSREFPV